MIRALVARCLRLRVLVIALSVVLLVLGARTASSARIDVFPEFAPPKVEIQTEAPGLSALEVEKLVTTPLERGLAGVPFVTAMRSKSVLGLSSVTLLFESDVDPFRARQLVQERVAAQASSLPALAKPPVMLSPLSSTSRVMKIGIGSKTASILDLSDLVRFTVRPRLMAVPGVANVAVWGERPRELEVRVDPEKLETFGVRLDDVVTAAREATTPASLGYVDTKNQRLAVTEAPFGTTREGLAAALVASRPGGATVRLGDVARVSDGAPPPIGAGAVTGGDGLLLIVEKQPWGNTVEVTRGVESALEALRPAMPGVEIDPRIFRPATFVERAFASLGSAVTIGCVLVVVVLFAFLYDVRTAFISVTAIPLSLVAAAAVLALRGQALDTMSITGLVVALGEVVDDAIVDVENIERRLAQNASSVSPRPRFDVVVDASVEVRGAVVYATAIVVLVFVPVYFLDGLAGAFFRPLAVSYVLAVSASLLVALVLTPTLSYMLLRHDAVAAGHRGPLARVVARAYAPVVERIVSRWRAAIAVMAVAFVAAAAVVPALGEGFLPRFQETDVLMHWVGRPGTSVEEMQRLTESVRKELLAVPGVRHFGAHIGRAEVADEVVGPNFAELWVSLDPSVDRAATLAAIDAIVHGYPGLYRDVQTYLEERMKEVLTGGSGALTIRVYGPDLGVLRAKAEEVRAAVGAVPGASSVKVEPQVLLPEVVLTLDPARLERAGLTAGEVRRTFSTYMQGARVGEVVRDDRTVAVVVRGEAALRADVTTLGELRVPLARVSGAPGPTVRLADLGTVEVRPSPNVVLRDGGSRRIDVTCDASGRDLGGVARDVREVVAKIAFPEGHHAEVLGQHEAREKARRGMVALSVLSLVGIALVLYADFRSTRLVLFVMGTLPFALVGGIAGVLATGGVVSLGSLVGLVTVLGIAARNGILLVGHFRHLEREEGVAFGRELVVRGARERVVPVVMTALTTALALVPLVVVGEKPGNEIERPMAIVILGGLVSSTLLCLTLVPALYLRFGASPTRERD